MTSAPTTGAREHDVPSLACDCHFHVFDALRYPYASGCAYNPPDALIEAFQGECAARGIGRAVLVHPSVFGADHRSFEATMSAHRGWLRGVCVVYADESLTTDADIVRRHALGTRGTRINTLFPSGASECDISAIAARVRSFGWHIQLLVDVLASPNAASRVADQGLPVVVDHFGHHSVRELLASEGFARLLGLLREGRAWVKLSAPYRISTQAPDWPDVRPVVDALLTANPERLLWGSDWPHPDNPVNRFAAPSQQVLTNLLLKWLPTSQLRQQVLVDNPARLYWHDTTM